MGYDTHVCLVSAQPLPNLIPILHQDLRPRRVVLLVSDDMQQRARTLGEILPQWGLAVESRPVSHTDGDAVRKAVEAVLAERKGERVVLNVTGGTKIMALAAYEAFRVAGQPVFYVDTDSDEIRFLWEGPVLPMANVVDTTTYLRAYGYKMTEVRESVPDAWAVAARTMGAQVGRWREALLALNACCEGVAKHKLATPRPVEYSAGMGEVLSLLERHGLVRVEVARGRRYLRFPGPEELGFIRGGWLEVYVYDLVRRMEGALEPLMGVKCLSARGVTNELDVVFTFRNRLFIVECKSGKGKHNKGMPYKLDAVRDKVGGLFGRVMYVSVDRVSDMEYLRAQEWKMQVVQGEEIAALPDILQAWTGAGRRGEG